MRLFEFLTAASSIEIQIFDKSGDLRVLEIFWSELERRPSCFSERERKEERGVVERVGMRESGRLIGVSSFDEW